MNDYLRGHGDYIGLNYYYEKERYIWEKLHRLQEIPVQVQVSNVNAILDTEKTISRDLSEKHGRQIKFKYTEEQIRAIEATKMNNVVLITGAAGTGKTFIMSAIINQFKNYSIALCSLSAKAANRMTELTHFPASTIHKVLEFSKSGFKYTEDNPLPYWVIIVDEFSMVNVSIAKHLIEAVMDGAKLIIVGDKEQLPPIGAGLVFADLLKSDLPVYKLTKIHRQEADSGIIVDSNKVKDGHNPFYKQEIVCGKWYTHGELKDIHYLFSANRQLIHDKIIEAFLRGVERFGIEEVLICVPTKDRGLNCTAELNREIQRKLITDKVKFLVKGKDHFYIGDRIIQRENDYHGKDVINGEIGYIRDIDDESFTVEFTDRNVVYTLSEVKEIELAYALTVHLYQGSQIKMVIVGLDMSHYILLSRQLLYTAKTRAQENTVIIAEKSAYDLAIHVRKNDRKTFMQTIN